MELARSGAHAAPAITAPHAGSAAASRHLLGIAATTTTGGLVLESTFAVERLLSRREHEFLAAIAAFDYLVYIGHEASGNALATKKDTAPDGQESAGARWEAIEGSGGAFRR